MASKVIKELRDDSEVLQKLTELDQASRQYMAFDMQKMQNDMNKELESQIGKMTNEYKIHQQDVTSKLKESEAQNKNSQVLKQESVNMRLQKQKGLMDISNKNVQFEDKYQQDNS